MTLIEAISASTGEVTKYAWPAEDEVASNKTA
jgi:hypothetical protein